MTIEKETKVSKEGSVARLNVSNIFEFGGHTNTFCNKVNNISINLVYQILCETIMECIGGLNNEDQHKEWVG